MAQWQCLPSASNPCSCSVVSAITLWLATIVFWLTNLGGFVAEMLCQDSCGNSCWRWHNSTATACHGEGDVCFNNCHHLHLVDAPEFANEQECVASKRCRDVADAERTKALLCEARHRCAEKSFLSSDAGGLIALLVTSILPVMATMCLGLYKEAFRCPKVIAVRYSPSRLCGRLLWLLGCGLVLYACVMLQATFSHMQVHGAAFIVPLVSGIALIVNCLACMLLAVSRWCLMPDSYDLGDSDTDNGMLLQ
eukprot:TRINITY_DN41502_c0_g1_i1.p1 TRINITY_DN41502_c0_g1~~TRINITY_DN41502_c0_g1_i1.p1  ORF type:complete len:251 (-),score=35.62 TRINITY_DN41502_c0_g1_i1:43-795(-)